MRKPEVPKIEAKDVGRVAALAEQRWDTLTEVQKSAVSLGVDADQWKPIGFMNEAHYATLLKNNAIGEQLAQGLEAYKHVSMGGK